MACRLVLTSDTTWTICSFWFPHFSMLLFKVLKFRSLTVPKREDSMSPTIGMRVAWSCSCSLGCVWWESNQRCGVETLVGRRRGRALSRRYIGCKYVRRTGCRVDRGTLPQDRLYNENSVERSWLGTCLRRDRMFLERATHRMAGSGLLEFTHSLKN